MGAFIPTRTPASVTFSTPASTERPRSTPAAPASGSTNTAASATGQRQQTGRNARPRPTPWRPQTDSSAPRRPLLTSLANTILISPREQGCELGLVYNELTKQCDAPENVPECKDYYAFLDDEPAADNKRRK